MTIKEVKGLKYPDEYIIKYFFKKGFHQKQGKVIEFGSGTGNNLSLFYQYHWDVIGVDIFESATNDAVYNFNEVYSSDASKAFFTSDMSEFIVNNKNIQADVFLLPGVISYLSKEDFIHFLKLAKEHNVYRSGAEFFIRTRSKKDYRFGLGKKVGEDSFLMTNNVTGEEGALCTCYDESELVLLLQKHLGLDDSRVFTLENQNEQNGEKILNADMVIWGTIS